MKPADLSFFPKVDLESYDSNTIRIFIVLIFFKFLLNYLYLSDGCNILTPVTSLKSLENGRQIALFDFYKLKKAVYIDTALFLLGLKGGSVQRTDKY